MDQACFQLAFFLGSSTSLLLSNCSHPSTCLFRCVSFPSVLVNITGVPHPGQKCSVSHMAVSCVVCRQAHYGAWLCIMEQVAVTLLKHLALLQTRVALLFTCIIYLWFKVKSYCNGMTSNIPVREVGLMFPIPEVSAEDCFPKLLLLILFCVKSAVPGWKRKWGKIDYSVMIAYNGVLFSAW